MTISDDSTTTRIRLLDTVSDAQQRELAAVLADCVDGGASVSFMQPLTEDRAGEHGAVQKWLFMPEPSRRLH